MGQQTPKSRARKIIKAWMANENTGNTIENDLYLRIAEEIEAAIREAEEREREACAIAVDGLIRDPTNERVAGYNMGCIDAAAAIRARGKP